MDDLTNSNPGDGTTATLETAPATANGTVHTNGEAAGAQSASVGEETFTKVDPRTLPPALRQSYDNMLRDYKEKTTKLSETIKSEAAKATEAYRAKAEFYDQIAAQEEFVKQWNDHVQKSQAANNGQTETGDPALSKMEQKIKEMSEKLQMTEMSQVTDAFAEAVNEKGEKLHPDFDMLNSISIGKHNGTDDYSLLRAAIELATGNSPQEKLAVGYKEAKRIYDSIFEQGKKAGMGRLQAKALNGSLPPTNAGGEVLSVTDKKPKNAHEALAMARRGQVVSRD